MDKNWKRGHTSSIWSLAALPDNTLASGYSDEQAIKIWDIVDGKELKALSGHNSGVTSLVVLPDNRLASGSQDRNMGHNRRKTIKNFNRSYPFCHFFSRHLTK